MVEAVELGSGWWVLLLGWPAIIAAIALFSLAAARRSRALAAVGLLLAAPMFLYLSATPLFQWVAPVAFALLCVLVFRFGKLGGMISALLALPAAAVLAWLAWAVLTQ